MDAGVLKPRGDLSEAIVAEWSTEFQRLAQDRVTQADKATIVNVIRTYELLSSMKVRMAEEKARNEELYKKILHFGTPAQGEGDTSHPATCSS